MRYRFTCGKRAPRLVKCISSSVKWRDAAVLSVHSRNCWERRPSDHGSRIILTKRAPRAELPPETAEFVSQVCAPPPAQPNRSCRFLLVIVIDVLLSVASRRTVRTSKLSFLVVSPLLLFSFENSEMSCKRLQRLTDRLRRAQRAIVFRHLLSVLFLFFPVLYDKFANDRSDGKLQHIWDERWVLAATYRKSSTRKFILIDLIG